MHRTAQVIVPLPLDQAFTYAVPPAFADAAVPGARVLVPFGNQMLTGMVVEVGSEDTARLREILDVLDDEPAFSAELLRLTRWISEYYLSSWGLVMKAALPGGIEVEGERRVTVVSAEGSSALSDSDRWIVEFLEHFPNGLTVDRLRRELPATRLHRLRPLEEAGFLSIETVRAAPEVSVRREPFASLAEGYDTRRALAEVNGTRQREVVAALGKRRESGAGSMRQADLLRETGASAATLRRLAELGLVEIEEREVVRSPFDAEPGEAVPERRHVLHPAQNRALEEIAQPISDQKFRTFLLRGVTGSGKTEVYIEALKQVLAAGRTAVVLVPEIALTPQTVQRFRVHFGDRIAVLHSRMSAGERYDAWRSLRAGRFDIVIGARSAIFAPLENIGLIVVDEEHESSYKQFDPAPRYHARDVAVMRAAINDAVCILGSATPSLESFANVEAGKYGLIEMPERVPVAGFAAAPLPQISVVDLANERKRRRLEGALSNKLREAISVRLQKGEQMILLQNRRGYTPVLACAACGWVQQCRDCAVSLTFHKARNHQRCHYCGRTERVPDACPECGESALAMLGAGTQKVEEELAALFPEARVLRMDQDTTGRKGAHRKILDRFGAGKADVLLGTQMVAKGLDFSRVTLVGVVNADTGMLLPDFRAAERTFQLLTQVAGRAGRGDLRGEVIIQTRNPDHAAIRFALDHDFPAFARHELAERRHFHYPPFSRIIAVEFRGPAEADVKRFAARWTQALAHRNVPAELIGPAQPAIPRIKRHFRYQTLIKMAHNRADAVKQAIRQVTAEVEVPRGFRVNVDVDAATLF